jgi:hypothetical protein
MMEQYMFNPITIVIDAFIDELVQKYIDIYGPNEIDMQVLASNARTALEVIASSDAPYHDIDHTMMVTMVGQEILTGKMFMEGGIRPVDWTHFVVALLNHDIGYVRGICRADRSGRYAINKHMDTIAPPSGATDAFLTPYHVDRAKIYVSERFDHDEHIDAETVCRFIERTRFPVPTESDHQDGSDLPGLLRAADLIGQLADPQYMTKISSLYHEFKETDQLGKMGYSSVNDVREGYPQFFWHVVSPFISDGIRFLRRTQEGQAWVANLYANVFTEEHDAPAYGPERRVETDRRDEKADMFKIRELTENDVRKQQRRSTDSDKITLSEKKTAD